MSVREKTEEPYMAMAQFSRRNGHANLHDVDYPRDGYIVLSIYEGQVVRQNTADFHMAASRLPLVEVAFSELQFAQLITTMNIGDGVPGTFQHRPVPGADTMHIRMDAPAKTTEQKFSDDVKASASTAIETSKEVTTALRELLAGKGSITKGALQAILAKAETAERELSANIPFILEQADQDIGDRSMRAKVEVTAFAQNLVHGLGLQTLGAERGAIAAEAIQGHVLIEDQSKG